jgi:hypothetical protein
MDNHTRLQIKYPYITHGELTTKSEELGTDHRHGMAITTGGPGILTTTWDRSRDTGPQEALIRLELVFN